MAVDTSPNTTQDLRIKSLKLAADQDLAPVKITGTDGGATTLTTNQLTVEVVPPASGTHTITLPPLAEWKGKMAYFYSRTSAPGGEIAIRLTENATDPIGDNITATGDKALLLNVAGDHVSVILETTT